MSLFGCLLSCLLSWLWVAVIVLGCGLRILWALRGARNALAVPTLGEAIAELPQLSGADEPRIVAIVPARDEAAVVGDAMRTFLDQSLPHVSVVAVNDRSSDGTGAVLDDLARHEDHLRVLHLDHLPPRWLGKVHALQRGCETPQARAADYLLFADADVHLAPGALARAVALCEAQDLDHLTLLPDLRAGTFPQAIVLWVFGALLMGRYDLTAVGTLNADGESPPAVGVGAFNLVRHSAFTASPGFGHLRLEVVDDVALGQMIDQAGHRSAARLAADDLSLDWYGSLPAMIRGLEKNAFAAVAFSPTRLTAALFAVTLLALAPTAALALGLHDLLTDQRSLILTFRGTFLLTLTATVALLHLRAARIFHHRLHARRLPALLTPIGLLLCGYIALRSAVLTLLRGGIYWRETFYPLGELRKGRRVKL